MAQGDESEAESIPPFERPEERWLEVVVGVACGIAGLGLVGFALFMGSSLLVERDYGAEIWFFVVSCLALGILFALLAYRLITGRPRRDGGLLSPLGLRLGGLFLLSAIVSRLVSERWAIPAGLGLLGGVVTCFSLARRRGRNPKEV